MCLPGAAPPSPPGSPSWPGPPSAPSRWGGGAEERGRRVGEGKERGRGLPPENPSARLGPAEQERAGLVTGLRQRVSERPPRPACVLRGQPAPALSRPRGPGEEPGSPQTSYQGAQPGGLTPPPPLPPQHTCSPCTCGALLRGLWGAVSQEGVKLSVRGGQAWGPNEKIASSQEPCSAAEIARSPASSAATPALLEAVGRLEGAGTTPVGQETG